MLFTLVEPHRGPRGRLQPLVRARPLLRRVHGRAVAVRRPALRRHPAAEGPALRLRRRPASAAPPSARTSPSTGSSTVATTTTSTGRCARCSGCTPTAGCSPSATTSTPSCTDTPSPPRRRRRRRARRAGPRPSLRRADRHPRPAGGRGDAPSSWATTCADTFRPELELGFSPDPAAAGRAGDPAGPRPPRRLPAQPVVHDGDARHVVGRAAGGRRSPRGRRRSARCSGPPRSSRRSPAPTPTPTSCGDGVRPTCCRPGSLGSLELPQPHRHVPDGHEPRPSPTAPSATPRRPGTRRGRAAAPACVIVGSVAVAYPVACTRRAPDRGVRRRAPPGAAAPGRRRPPPRRHDRRPARAQRHAEPPRHRRGPAAARAVEEATARARRAVGHGHPGGVGGR